MWGKKAKNNENISLCSAGNSFEWISGIHQYIEGSATPRTVQPVGQVTGTIMVVSPNKSCTAFVDLPADRPNLLRLPPGTTITLIAPIESCTLFGLANSSFQLQQQLQAQRDNTEQFR